MPIGLANPFRDFLTVISSDVTHAAKVACAPALKYYRDWIKKNPNGTFGAAIDALGSGAATGGDMTLASMWARWCLSIHPDAILPEVRDRFVQIMTNPSGHPKVCYQYLKANKPNLTEREIELLRAAIRGQLPNVPDADTL